MTDPSIVDRLHTTLRDRIAVGHWPPGARINESALSRDLGASRTPLREALNRLVGQGLLAARPGDGFRLPQTCTGDLLALGALRRVIEVTALHDAMIRAGDTAIAGLVTTALEVETALRPEADPDHLCALDTRFHAALCALGGQPALGRELDRLTLQLAPLRRAMLARPDQIAAHRTAHARIVVALAFRNPAKAEAALVAHIDRETEALAHLAASTAQTAPPRDAAA